MNKIMMWMVALMAVGCCSVVWAEPYAPKVEITAGTTMMGQMVIKGAKVPDRSSVAIPPYPGAVILQTRQLGDMQTSNGKPYLPYIKLLSPDSIDKVIAWYRKNLPSYFYQKSGFFGIYSHRFWKVKGDYGMMDMDAMGTIENVIITDGKQHADDYPPAKTMIEITYEPR